MKKPQPNNITSIQPPKAAKQDHTHKHFEDQRLDPYFWLKKKDSPEVLDYLNKENEYTDAIVKPVEKLKDEIFEEIKARIPKNDDSVPYKIGPYKYYCSWEDGKDYQIHKRIEIANNKEEVILDENKLAEKHSYCDISTLAVSPNHKLLAYALDSTGREYYDIHFKDLKTGKLLEFPILQITSGFEWANDNEHVFYVYQDRKTLRAYQIYKFNILTGKKELIFEEEDSKFNVFLSKSLSDEMIFIGVASSQTSEYYFLPADKPHQKPELFAKRKHNHEYDVGYGSGVFYIISNKDDCFNSKLLKVSEQAARPEQSAQSSQPEQAAKLGQPTQSSQPEQSAKQNNYQERYPTEIWEEFIPHDKEACMEGFEIFKDYLSVQMRRDGNLELEVLHKATNEKHKIAFPQEIYSCCLGACATYDTDTIRVCYTSFVDPSIVYDYHIPSRKLELKKQQKVLGDFNPDQYTAKREFVTSRDGKQIPVSIMYKKGLDISSSSAPTLLYGYGSYGISQNPSFSSIAFSLLDRGFIFAVAHIRGGADKGQLWYENGKFLQKKNTFNDFIDVSQDLIQKQYTSSEHLYIYGGSAGGLLIGAVINDRPDLFKAAIASVPFVDVLTTILDDSLPLTTIEYEEWGNPSVDKTYYDYIKSYSPYDNVKKQNYPHLFIDTGYHDPRVQYWEPAKWTAKLREYKTDDNLLMLSTNMGSGHFGDTGRFGGRLKLQALYYAFFIGIENGQLG